mmetsp:Transcript_18884/g.21058  ORF Transcript_18884/g.21058 Transcript_18884/m.21058 type:complete len:163 (+) Transcript_18884:42-530(+)
MEDNNEIITLRVTGLHRNLILKLPPTATINDIKIQVESKIYLPAAYQRLVVRGKKLEDGDVTWQSLGIPNRTRLMLIHNEHYAKDKKGITTICELTKEIDDLADNTTDKSPKVLQELITRICCKLDSVDTHGSENLRAMRKRAIQKAESIGTTIHNNINTDE